MSNWTIFSNHGHVLVCLARDNNARLRDVAADVGITERAVQKIVHDLQDCGMVSVQKQGRRNCYRIGKQQPLRHKLEAHCTLDELIGLVVGRSVPDNTEETSMNGLTSNAVAVETTPVEPIPDKTVLDQPVNEEKTEKPEAAIVDNIEHGQGSLF